ncbi:MAG: hypothetical protein ACI9XK_001246 [Granulosicoccus sp.]|jgi:hypothetical protein
MAALTIYLSENSNNPTRYSYWACRYPLRVLENELTQDMLEAMEEDIASNQY